MSGKIHVGKFEAARGREKSEKEKKVWTLSPVERKQAEMEEPVKRKSLEVRVARGELCRPQEPGG